MAIVKTWLVACVATLLLASHAADVVYPEKPETEPIVVGSGDTAMTQGYKLFRNDLWACWRFDDADNLFKDSSGHGHDLVPVYSTGQQNYGQMSRLTGDDDKVRGDGAVGLVRYSYLSVGTLPDCLKGGSPFTISMWVRETDQVQLSNGNPVGGYLYVGNSTTSHNDDFSTNCVAIQKGSATQFYVGIPGKNDVTYRSTLNLQYGTEMPEGNQGKWIHVALVYDPSAGARYTIADMKVTKSGYFLNPEAVDSVWFGLSRNGTSSRWLCNSTGTAQTAIDEIFVFTNALTDAEVAFVREHSDPTEFSVKWQVNKGGTLEVAGVEPQEVNGYGALVAPEGITLAPEGESYFGGTIESAYLALDAGSSAVTQTLAGAASYAGGTTVEKGTLVVRPEPTVPAALQDGLVGFWTFDDTVYSGRARDLSGNGNDMWVNDSLSVVAAPNAGGGKAIDFSQGGSANRWLAKTQTAPFDPNGETPAHQNGWPLTMAVWTQTRVPFNAAKAGLAAFEGRCAFGMAYPSDTYARRLSFGGRNNVGTGFWDADSDDEIGTALVTNAVHCYVLTFDPVAGKMVFFFDGVQKRSVDYTYSLYNGNPQWPGSGNFQIGAGYQSGTSQVYYNGLVDQAMLWNRPLSAEEVAALYAFGQHSAPAESTGTIPSATVLDVAPGATAVFENANETVSGIVGAGSLVVSSSAKLSVTGSFSSTGVFSGGGSIYLGPTLEFASPSTGIGEKEFATAPYGMLQMPSSTECWTITGTGVKQPVYSFRLRNNGNGTETLTCRVAPCGLFMVFR